MNGLFRWRGGFLLVLIAVAESAGCGQWVRRSSIGGEPVPVTNRVVAETVIRRAFDSLGIPGGNGAMVRWYVNESSSAYEFASVVAPEFLQSKGFRSTDADGPIPEIRFTVDTLYVSLNTVHSRGAGKRIVRSAAAHLSAAVNGADSTRTVYTGEGTFEDSFPASMIGVIGKSEPFVVSESPILNRVKPFVYGAVLTFFLWYLYSFRG